MSIDDMVLCVCVGIATGMIFKFIIEILFWCIRKIQGWLVSSR